jgi:hypothetical protein
MRAQPADALMATVLGVISPTNSTIGNAIAVVSNATAISPRPANKYPPADAIAAEIETLTTSLPMRMVAINRRGRDTRRCTSLSTLRFERAICSRSTRLRENIATSVPEKNAENTRSTPTAMR